MKQDVRLPAAVAYLVILLLVLGLYRFTALGVDEAPTLFPDAHEAPPAIALIPAPGSAAHLLVPVRLDGIELLFLLDTGASSSVLGRGTAEGLGLTNAARPIVGALNETWQVQHVLKISSLEVGPKRYGDFEMIVTDLAPIRAALGARVAGVLGANVLGAQVFEVDLARRRLWLGRTAPDFERARSSSQRDVDIDLHELGGGYFVKASAEDREALFLLDTGAARSQIGETLAAEVGTKHTTRGRSIDATGARVGTLIEARLTSLVVGDIVRTDVVVSVGETSLIGLDFLAGLHVRIDPGQERLTLRY